MKMKTFGITLGIICVLIFALVGLGLVLFLRVGDSEPAIIPVNNQNRSISASEARVLIDENPGAVILDVRTYQEFVTGFIPGAINIPYDAISGETENLPSDKDALILVYCRSGVRSVAALNELLSLGFNNVYEFGGIIHWPYETRTD